MRSFLVSLGGVRVLFSPKPDEIQLLETMTDEDDGDWYAVYNENDTIRTDGRTNKVWWCVGERTIHLG